LHSDFENNSFLESILFEMHLIYLPPDKMNFKKLILLSGNSLKDGGIYDFR